MKRVLDLTLFPKLKGVVLGNIFLKLNPKTQYRTSFVKNSFRCRQNSPKRRSFGNIGKGLILGQGVNFSMLLETCFAAPPPFVRAAILFLVLELSTSLIEAHLNFALAGYILRRGEYHH